MDFPRLDNVGTEGVLVRFGGTLSEPANRAALAFRAAIEDDPPEGLAESMTSLVSVFLRHEPGTTSAPLREAAERLLARHDWLDAALPGGRRHVRIPTLFGTDRAPQLAEAAEAAGIDAGQALKELGSARLRVTTIGFAPGQPYLGTLPDHWDIPRSTDLQKVPAAALVVAVKQLVLFSVASQTGWRHVGQTGFRLFRPEAETPFVLRPGDEVSFEPVDEGAFDRVENDTDGGAEWEDIA